MKKYYLFLVLFATNLINAQNFQDTKGELSVSGSGTASYKVPIALPPGIKDVAPQLALIYNGSSVQGMAGMGWNMVGISSITRTSSRLDLDGTIDAVDFDNLDRFALDGQRLIEKVGFYGAAGTTYQTENYSNLKIESAGNFWNKALETCITYNFGGYPQTNCSTPASVTNSAPENFKVTFPDGSQAFYGGTQDAKGLMEWMINRWIDPQGNYIDYTYETENNTIRIKKISWGKNTNLTSTFENLIEFTYKALTRAEYSYVNGIKIVSAKILSFVSVKIGGELFRTYTLEHETISGNYQRVIKVTEANGVGEAANPVVFDYNNTDESFGQFSYYNSPTNAPLNNVKLSGDFNGDGNQDFVTTDKLYLNPVGNNNDWTGIDFLLGDKRFTATTLTNGKLNQAQSIVKVDESLNSISFETYNLNPESIPFALGMSLNNVKTIDFSNSSNYSGCKTGTYTKDSNVYLEGDFNGDGISEVLIKSAISETKYYEMNNNVNYYNLPPECTLKEIKNLGFEYFMVDLDPSNPGSSSIQLSMQSDKESKDYIADFNGDGKADILIINEAFKTYKILTFKQIKAAPWVEVELLNNNILVQHTFAEYDKDKQLVFGDFNGDGKTDIMIPEAVASSNWFLYQSTGTGFERIAYPNFEWYEPFKKRDGQTIFPIGGPFPLKENIQTYKNYRAADLNKDGKSDFIINTYETRCVNFASGGNCDRDAIAFMSYKQNLGSTATQPVFATNINSATVYSDYGYENNIDLLIGDFKNHQANFNFAFIQGSQIWKGSFNKDLSQDATLIKVTEAGGGITQSISYKPLMPAVGMGNVNDLYSSSNTETYPFTELIQVPTMNVVDKVTVTGAGQTKSQLFKYFGLVTHSRGLGVLGFKNLARSSWYSDANTNKIWSCSQMNPQLLGQKLYEWTYSGDDHTSFINPPIAISGITDLGITINSFTANFLSDGVKIIVPNTSEKKDFLTSLSNKTEFFMIPIGTSIEP